MKLDIDETEETNHGGNTYSLGKEEDGKDPTEVHRQVRGRQCARKDTQKTAGYVDEFEEGKPQFLV